MSPPQRILDRPTAPGKESSRMTIRTITATAVFAALALLSSACSDDEQSPRPATSTPSVTSTQLPSTTASEQPVPSASVRTKPGAPPQVTPPNPGNSTPPCESTICTNPNHGAGSKSQENGGAVMPDPHGSTAVVPCEGTICTNPNHGAGN